MDPYSFYLLDPDPYSGKLLDPDPQKMNADPLPRYRHRKGPGPLVGSRTVNLCWERREK